ncbi:DUF6249 domain-containing protein [uncultured Algibacter sp.]|uniref:DUF6249 domain-containing protein n=1 Tax=uncultured Algibacter sp. TaxID=298659 RepID=UPI0030EF0AC7|tara:strand:+ start:868 stop:1206 length:339 start_codon:yes stop_codon:yes gene_type:complete
MNDFLGPGAVLAALFLSAGYTVYTFIKASHLERMAKIEKGIDTNTLPSQAKFLSLKIGLLMIGIACGLLLAYILEQTTTIKGEVFYPSFMLLFGGLSLIISFFWTKNLNKNQ